MAKRRYAANTLAYKGYLGIIEYDDEAGIFYGEVINLADLITFQGSCVTELREALKESVEDYLAFCAERGEAPEKPFSGNLPLQIDPDLHRKIYVKARQEGKSLNHWIIEALEHELG